MKKVISVKEIMIILISVLLITILATNVYGTNPLLGNGTPKPVSPDDYNLAKEIEEGNNTNGNNVNGNNTNGNNTNGNNTNGNNTNGNNTKVYNTNNNTDLPQTGIEDYNIGILMVICIASAIFAYRKISDYKNI